jgi:signal-transduction protein with cAMP-binding, CBS, and nucleotidyltransferase domain
MVRAGSVEVVVHDGRVLDLLGPGELFGQASMISGLPTGFETRAAEDTVCYRIPADVVRPLMARADVLQFVARSIISRQDGTLDAAEASTLREAFGLIFSLRLDHQVDQVRRGEAPDDFIDPKQLNPLARSYLREAFRAVASVQAGLAAELSLGVRWG